MFSNLRAESFPERQPVSTAYTDLNVTLPGKRRHSHQDGPRTTDHGPRTFVSLLAASLLAVAGCSQPSPHADLVLLNGKIVTVDSTMPEVSALAAAGDTIMALGDDETIRALVGPNTRVIDLDGKMAMPGFIEGHAHFMGLGESRMNLDLTKAHSWEDIVGMVGEAAGQSDPGAWITGRGWHQEKWDSLPPGPIVDGVPTNESLSEVSPDNPVLLEHASGHSSFANAMALRKGAVSAETPNPPGGEIVRDVRGEPTGLLRETAQHLVYDAMQADLSERTPEQILAEKYQEADLASEEAIRKGITSFHDAGESFATIDFFKRLVDEGRLPLRLYVMVSGDSPESLKEHLADYWMIDYGDLLTVRSIKLYMDGALGSHGAWLLKPYLDMPSSSGLNVTPLDTLIRSAQIAAVLGFQVNTHAIGDRANREVLNIYEDVLATTDDPTGQRWRIEHAQHIDPADIPRFAQLGVVASMQAIHATSDGPWVPKRIGDKRAGEGAYVWQSLWKTGAVVTNGTDAPVEDIDPIPNFYASVSRRLKDGTVFYPDQRLSRQQALEAYTINNAYDSFHEDKLGSLTQGKWADIVVLSKDLMTIPEEEIPSTEVVYTIVGGKVVYEAARP